jgi:menaquinone-dependent protoporphyrinogen IX oxidase
MTSILVTFDPGDGRPRTAGAYAASVLSARRFDVTTVPLADAGDVDLTAFDGVLVCTSDDDGTPQPEVVAFADANREALATTQSGCCLVTRESAVDDADRAVAAAFVDELRARTGWTPDRVEWFAGAFTSAPYGTPRRWLFDAAAFVRSLGSDDRRREHPDWPDVERFAVAFGKAVERERKRAVAAERDRRPIPAWVGAPELWMSLLALGIAVALAIGTRGRDRDREDALTALDVPTEAEASTANLDEDGLPTAVEPAFDDVENTGAADEERARVDRDGEVES